MTDKQIIIDGVDVSGCKHYNPEQYFKCNIGCCHCEENPNCYYKQLKRKEQECEEINLTNERLVAEKYTMNEEILKLKQELEERERDNKIIDAKILSIKIINGKNTDLKINKDVYDIEFKLIKDNE